jgi:hypothetical protein
MMYGATRSDLLVLEKSFPNLYKEYINTDLVFDEVIQKTNLHSDRT